MNDTSFTLLRKIGAVKLGEDESIRFSIDSYRGYRYVSVRRYLETDGFSGATRDGITLSPEIVRALVPRLEALPTNLKNLPDGIVGKFAKRAGVCVMVSVSTFRELRGLDLRQFEEGRGYTKKGIWIPLEKLPRVKKLFADTLAALDEKPDNFDF